MTTNFNINRDPSLQCPQESDPDHDIDECQDPAHYISCMYQTQYRVNVEVCDWHFDNEVVIAEMVTEAVGLHIAQEWIAARRAEAQA